VTVTILDLSSVCHFDAFDRAPESWKWTVDTKNLKNISVSQNVYRDCLASS